MWHGPLEPPIFYGLKFGAHNNFTGRRRPEVANVPTSEQSWTTTSCIWLFCLKRNLPLHAAQVPTINYAAPPPKGPPSTHLTTTSVVWSSISFISHVTAGCGPHSPPPHPHHPYTAWSMMRWYTSFHILGAEQNAWRAPHTVR